MANNKKGIHFYEDKTALRSVTVLGLFPTKGHRKNFHVDDYINKRIPANSEDRAKLYSKAYGDMWGKATEYKLKLELDHKQSQFHIIENYNRTSVKRRIKR